MGICRLAQTLVPTRRLSISVGYEPVQQILAGNAGHGAFVRDGSTFFARYEPLPLYGWGILVEQPAAVFQQSVWAIERRVWLFWVVFIVVAFGRRVCPWAWLRSC